MPKPAEDLSSRMGTSWTPWVLTLAGGALLASEVEPVLRACGLLAALAGLVHGTGPVRDLDHRQSDRFFAWMPSRAVEPRIQLVTLDQATLEEGSEYFFQNTGKLVALARPSTSKPPSTWRVASTFSVAKKRSAINPTKNGEIIATAFRLPYFTGSVSQPPARSPSASGRRRSPRPTLI